MKKFTIIVASILLITCLLTFVACNKNKTQTDANTVTIQYVAEASGARVALAKGDIDFALVGEPAATAFGTEAGGGFSARLNIQEAYATASGKTNFPQAGIFVKESVAKDADFMSAFFTALASSKEWVLANPSLVTAQMQANGSASNFPAPSIARCAIKATALTSEDKDEVTAFLSAVLPNVNFSAVNLFNVDGNEKLNVESLRIAVPDGTPALTIARLFSDNTSIGGITMNYEIIPASTVATEIGSGRADIIIAPVNAGANLIKNGANYRMVSTAVEGSLYIVGHPNKVDGRTEITLDDLKGKIVACIGQGGTPDLVLKYVLSGMEGITIK